MDEEILDAINKTFKTYDVAVVIKELSAITLDHVMAESEYNLKNTRVSILELAKGNVSEVVELSKNAKVDFRNVIMWAIEEKNKLNK